MPQDSMSISYSLQKFDDVSWHIAQSTGALAYMSYSDAQKYADIYEGQDLLARAQQAALDDAVRATGIVASRQKLSSADIDDLMSRIGVLQVRLNFVESAADSVSRKYSTTQNVSK